LAESSTIGVQEVKYLQVVDEGRKLTDFG